MPGLDTQSSLHLPMSATIPILNFCRQFLGRLWKKANVVAAKAELTTEVHSPAHANAVISPKFSQEVKPEQPKSAQPVPSADTTVTISFSHPTRSTIEAATEKTPSVQPLPTQTEPEQKPKLPSQINDAVEAYLLALKLNHCSRATIRNYKSDIKQFCGFADENNLDKIFTKPKLLEFADAEAKRGLQASTVKRKLISIAQFAVWARRGKLITDHRLLESLDRAEAPDILAFTSSHQPTGPADSSEADMTATGSHGSHSMAVPPALTQANRASRRRLPSLPQLPASLVNQWLPYFNLSLLALFVFGLGFFVYRQFQHADPTLAYPNTLTRPSRILSFQGRLTNVADTPIVLPTAMHFKLYNDPTAGTLLWDSNTCSIDPDQDGVFSANLGAGAGGGSDTENCGAEIGSNVFSENPNIWLEVTVGAETLNPRQPIRTVAYALNAETLQGYPASASAVENTVLVMDNSGEVVLGNANPKIKATGTTLTVEGKSLTLQTPSGSATDLSLISDKNIILDAGANAAIIAKDQLAAPGATLSANYAGGTALTVKAGPSATADITQWTTSTGTVMDVVDANGNLGVGNSAPGQKVDITGNLQFSGALMPGSSAGSSGQFLVSAGAGVAPTWTSTIPATTVPFSGLSSGTNTSAAMVVGSGASLDFTGSGTINASTLLGSTWVAPAAIGSGTPNTGAFTTLTSSGNATLGTGASSINSIGSGTSSINTIGSTTTPGALTLHGATTLDNTFTVSGSNLTSLGGDLTVTGNIADNGGSLTTTQTTGNLFNTTATTLNIGGAATTINVGPTGSGASSVLFGGGSGDTGCTIDGATGNLTCSGVIAGSAATSKWNAITNPDGNLTLAMGATTTAFNWANSTTSANNMTFSLSNTGGTPGTDNLMVLSNALSSNTTGDLNTEALLLLDQADTTASGNTALDNAIWITNSGGSTLTDAIHIGSGTQAITNGIDMGGSTGIGTDLILQNNATIDNNTNGTVNIGTTTLKLTGGTDVISDQATVNLFNTTTSTLNIGGAATTALNLGNDNGNYSAINLGSGTGTHTINIAGTGATAADIVNIGTGGTGADTITIGNNSSTTSLAFTSGTGSQTHTSSNASGTTTGSSFVFSDPALTVGTGLYVNQTSTPIANTATTQNLFDTTYAQGTTANTNGFVGLGLNFTDATTVAGNTEYAMQIQNQATSGSPTDNAISALLRLDNADTATGNLVAVTNGLLITNSGAASAGIVNGITVGSGSQSITNGLKIGSTGVTTDILLQNGATIDNHTSGSLNIGATTLELSGVNSIHSNQTTVALLDTSTTTLNIGGAANTINLAGGSGAGTGCTLDGTTGNLVCTGTISGSGIVATSMPFSGITSATNTAAAMVVGSGASLNFTGSGTINASTLLGGTWAVPGAIGSTTPNTGAFTTLSASSTVTLSGLTASRAVFTDASSNLVTTGTSAMLLNTLSDETGTGVAVFGTAPTFTTSITDPLVIGGTTTTSPLTLRSTSGAGTTNADIIFQTGNNGGTEDMRILNNGNVGIGTASPNTKLSVQGTDLTNTTTGIGIVQIMGGTATNGNFQPLDFTSTTFPSIAMARIAAKTIPSPLGGRGNLGSELFFQTNDWVGTDALNTAMVIDGSGNVGINNVSPAQKLDVTGNVQFSGALMPGSTAGTSGQFLISGGPSVAPTWTSTVPATSVPFSGITSGTNTSAAMVVGAGSSLDFTSTGTINASTLLGGTWASPGAIGSTTPNTGAFAGTSNAAATFSVTNNTATTLGAGGDTLGVLDLQSTSLTTGNFLNVEANALTSGKGLNLTSTSTGLTGDLASITASGNNAGVTGNVLKVGLTGASATGTALNVTTAGASGYALRVNDDGTYTDSTPFVIDTNGNVGAGTTAPTVKLDVAGSGRFTDTAKSVLTGTIDPTASASVTGVGTLFTTELSVGDELVLTSVITGSIDPTASANVVGVGTAFTTDLSVGDQLTVSGETRNIIAITDNTHLAVDTAFSDNANDTAPQRGQVRTVTAIASNTSLTVDSAFADTANDTSPEKMKPTLVARDSNNTTQFVVNGVGNIGIGTNAPGPINKLDLYNGATHLFYVNDSKYAFAKRWYDIDNTAYYLEPGASSSLNSLTIAGNIAMNTNTAITGTNLTFGSAGTTTLGGTIVTTAANVGIGTVSPSYPLDVVGPARAYSLLTDDILLSASSANLISAYKGFSGFTNFSGGLGTGGNGRNSVTPAERITGAGNLVNIGSIQAGQTLLTSAGTLAAKADYTTGSVPLGTAVGDLNGDGWSDVVVTNNSAPSISVFINNGDGTFAAKVDYTTGSSPRGVAIGDLNGDGKADIVVANSSSASVSVFINNGDGTFAAKVDYTTGTTPYAVALGDFNSDGKLDIATPNFDATSVSVLMNNGKGTFAAKADYTVGGNPAGIAVADFNGDGKADLVTANSSSNTASVLMNNGDGTFAAKADYTTGTTPYWVAAADLSGDGKADFVTANAGTTTVSVFLNNGAGTFAAKADYTVNTAPRGVAIGDLNGDGIADLAVTSSASNTVSVLANNGAGTFAAKVDSTTGSDPRVVSIGDVNNDGKADVIVANLGSTTMSVFLNTKTTMLFAQASTGNIGIGTTTPGTFGSVALDKTLDVIGTSTGYLGIGGNRSADGIVGDINFYNTAIGASGTDDRIGVLRYTRSGANNSGQFDLFTRNAGTYVDAMTILPSGNIGVGLTNPTTKFSVLTTTANDQAIRGINNAVTGNNYGGVFAANGTGATQNVGLYSNAAGGTSNMGLYLDSIAAATNNWALYSNSAAQSYFAGNVGIGVSVPLAKLNVANAAITGGAPANSGSAADPNSALRVQIGSVAFDTGVMSSGVVWQQPRLVSAYGTNFGMSLVPNGGNVGIGTTNPIGKLQVDGTWGAPTLGTFTNDLVTIEGSGTPTLSIGGYSTSPFALWLQGKRTADSASFPIALNPLGGNVGIGTASPGVKLDVAGSGVTEIRAIDSTSYGVLNATGSLSEITILGGGAGDATNYIESANAAGNANATLNISGFSNTLGSTLNLIFSNTVASGSIQLPDDTSIGKLKIGSIGSSLSRQSSDGSTILQTAQAFLLLNPTGGNFVGVGLSNPVVPLQVSGSASFTVPTGSGGNQAGNVLVWQTVPSGARNVSILASNGVVGAFMVATSDRRLKENITPLNPDMVDAFFNTIDPVMFRWISDQATDSGFIAQDLIKKGFGYLISAVPDPSVPATTDADGFVSPAGMHYVVSYNSIIPILAAGIQKNNLRIASISGQLADSSFTDTGDLTLSGNLTDGYTVATPTGVSTKIGAFATTVIAQVQAGYANIKDLFAERATVTHLQVGDISPIASSSAVVVHGQLNADQVNTATLSAQTAQVTTVQTETLATQNLTGQTATISGTTRLGNLLANTASISGSLTTDTFTASQATVSSATIGSARLNYLESKVAELETARVDSFAAMTATISGTLYAANIADFDQKVAQTFRQPSLLATLLNQDSGSIPAPVVPPGSGAVASSAAQLRQTLAQLNPTDSDIVINPTALFVKRYFEVAGDSYLAGSVGIGSTLVVGDGLRLTGNEISYEPTQGGNIVFKIQPSGKGKLELMGGQLTLSDTGLVVINGDLRVAGAFTTDGDIQVVGPEGSTAATISSAGVINTTGSINTTSSITSTSTISANLANFANLKLGTEQLTATGSGVVSTTQPTGRAKLSANQTEITLKSELITPQTLIYITPLGSTNNQVLYVKSQTPEDPTTPEKEGEFKIGVDQPLAQDIEFTWWLVN